jgi:YD repeat-containing protein
VGNLVKKTDARGTTMTYGYDNVNRMTAKSSSDGTLSYTYNYDATDGNSESNPLGRLTFASNQVNAAESYSYDPMGRVVRSTYCVPQDCHYDIAVSAVYDLAGRPTSITYPDTRTVSQGYNGAGQISSVGYKSWGGTSIGSSYLTVPGAGGYDAAGHLTSATMGNGVQLASAYNPRETVASLGYKLGTTSLWSKQYSWYPNENLQLITDAISGVQRQFTYDDVNRLQTVEDLAGTSGATGETTATSDEAEENVLSGGSQIWGSASATITANAAAAPDGTQTATVVSVTAGTTDHFSQAGIPNPALYDGAAFSGTVWLKVPSGTLATSIYIVQIGDQGWSIAGQTAVTITTSWQRFTVSGTLQNGLTAVAFQLGGGHTITGGQVYDVWGAELGPSAAGGGIVTNILPSSEQVAGSSWVINNGSVTNNALAAPDNTNTAATVTGNSGSNDMYLVDYLQNPSQYSGKTVTASVYLRVNTGDASSESVCGQRRRFRFQSSWHGDGHAEYVVAAF